MQYMCLVYIDPAKAEALSRFEQEELDEAAVEHDERLSGAGRLIVARALEPVATATTVRVRNGRLSTTDGPFAETNEQLGGFLLIEAENLDEAIEIASRAPVMKIACIEVRPVTDLKGLVASRRAARAVGDPASRAAIGSADDE